MSDTVVLEVIGGPMDGLRGCIDRKGTVGRKVGNSLSLALDEEVSGRHAEIVKEGHDWCVRDLNSTNGTFHLNEKLQAGRSYPLNMHDVLLVGSTVLEVDSGREGEACIPFSESSFSDPRTLYSMTSRLERVWDHFFGSSDEDRPLDRCFCDVDRLFLAMMEIAGETTDAGFDCIRQIKSPGRYRIIAPWLVNVPEENLAVCRIGPLTVASRVWKVLSLAAERKKEAIGIGDVLGAILEEGGSLAARYIRKDKRFMEAFGMKLRRGASDQTVIDIVRTAEKSPASAASPSDGQHRTQPSLSSPGLKNPAVPPSTPGLVDEHWKSFGQRLERLVSGFLDDAVNPVASQQDFHPPGLEKKLEEVLAAGSGDPQVSNQQVKHYLDTLYNLLVLILASQRDGYRAFADYFCTRLETTVHEIQESRALLPMGKKSVDVEELLSKVKAVRRTMDTEGISETIVRDIIKKKIQQLGL